MDRNIDVVRFYSVENEILFVYSTALERTLQPAAALSCGAKTCALTPVGHPTLDDPAADSRKDRGSEACTLLQRPALKHRDEILSSNVKLPIRFSNPTLREENNA
jgi:hypothetical protein